MRKRYLAALMLALLIAAPVLADEDTPPMESMPPDDLTKTPMECLIPSMPSLLLDNASTPADVVRSGVSRINDFVQNTAVYLNCTRNKFVTNADIVYGRIMDAVNAKLNSMQEKKTP